MKRRKALLSIAALAGVAAAIPGIKWALLNSEPDLDYLDRSKDLLASIADTIIPKTDSPSASECMVPEFIVNMVKNCSDTPTQNKFVDGLSKLESYTQDKYSKPFGECSEDERVAVLTHFESTDRPWSGIAGKVQRRYLGTPFFLTLKRYCAIGYFTSEGGATKALRYSHIPARYVACEPYSPGQKAWATF
jgi:hypothetical protein